MHNPAMSFRILLLFLCSYMLISISLTSGQICYETGNFTANSIYATNRNLTLSSLASYVKLNGGFYNTTIGQGLDKVYGLVLCSGGATPELCAKCVDTGIQSIMVNCPNQKQVVSWGDGLPCIIRYADEPISGKLELRHETAGHSVNKVMSNLTEFNQIWESLMDRVVRKASTGSSRLKFGTGEANLSYFQKIYALMQCTPDISQGDCDTCLRQNVAGYQSCCGEYLGGIFQNPSCVFHWELHPFYTAAIDVAPPPSSILPPPPSQANSTTPEDRDSGGKSTAIVVIIAVSTIIIILVLIAITCVFLRRRSRNQKIRSKQSRKNADETKTMESLQFDFSTIKVATNDFSTDNMLGQGGFGAVYKGSFSDGQIIAVKRLTSNSEQGELEFKNEILLVARLQHRNLVRLLGFCWEGSERLIIYEFMPNSSLDNFIFDAVKRLLLDWEKRYKIIGGIARGILYLHQDSRLRIIHRDLKASNILLDQEMNPKISDFGMARLFEMDQSQADTKRVVGTFGYMAPEYLLHGQFSVKSDVFSFGVLVLEIISGQKNSSFRNGEEAGDLLTYAWESWREGTALNLIDPILRGGSTSEMMRCIHIGLLCVQENVANRPTMDSVVLMLTSCSMSLQVPTKPAFFMHTTAELDNQTSTMFDKSKSHSVECSVNEVSITELDPR